MNTCPINGDNHKYFLFKTVSVFEVVSIYDIINPDMQNYSPTEVLYKKVEYAIMNCQCGSVVREKVKDGFK